MRGFLVCLVGIEPTTFAVGGRHSIQLRYRHVFSFLFRHLQRKRIRASVRRRPLLYPVALQTRVYYRNRRNRTVVLNIIPRFKIIANLKRVCYNKREKTWLQEIYFKRCKVKTVIVGMSGGVDSSVAALLLKEQGYNVIGLYMMNWEEDSPAGACTAESDFNDVRRVCSALNVPYYSVNFSKQYQERVFKHFLDEYRAGRTPNPDVACNREIKFGPFREYALSMGADFVATGHYCGIEHKDGKNRLLKAQDSGKDQTYFLNQVREYQLNNVLFPLSGLMKDEVRKIAEENGLATAEKKDSTGICFIGERNFRKFLRNYLPAQPGKIITLDGETVGEHIGLMYYTIGQRKGLDLGGKQGEEGRWFVVRKDLKNNILYVSHGDESPLYSKACKVENLNWIGYTPQQTQFFTAKFRHRQPEQSVKVTLNGDGKATVEFEKPQRAVTEGQYAAFYDDEACLGGGLITEVIY